MSSSAVDLDRLTEALATLQDAGAVDDVRRGFEALAAGARMHRYTVLHLLGMQQSLLAIHHNAPDAAVRADLVDRARLDGDPIITHARERRVPATWGSDPLVGFYERHADLGYRSGIVASAIDRSGTTCVVQVSTSDAIQPALVAEVVPYVSLAATAALVALERIRKTVSRTEVLTSRELDCLLYVLAGKSTKETARALGIGTRSVSQYLERARQKVGVRNSYAAAALAVRRGWLDMDQASVLAESAPTAPTGTGKS